MEYDVEVLAKIYMTIEAEDPNTASDIALETWEQNLNDYDTLAIDVYDEDGEIVGGK